MLLILLFICFLIILVTAYFSFKKDLIAPAVIFMAMYVVSVFSTLLNLKKWEIDFHLNTFLVLLIGAIEFTAICYLIYRLFKKKNNVKIKGTVNYKSIANWKVYIASIYGILVVVLLFINVLLIANRYGTFNSISQALGLFKEHTSYHIDASLPLYLKWLQKPMYAFAYIFMYYYIKEIIYNRKVRYNFIKKAYMLIPSFCFILQEVLSSNRLSILSLMIGAFVMFSIVWYNKNNWDKNISLKTIMSLSLIAVLCLVLFYYSAPLVGRKNNKGMFDYITLYTGGSIECFNRFMQDKNINSNIVGEESFYYLVKNLYDYKIINLEKFYPIHLEFRNLSTGVTIGNVYTAYRRWIHDFGFIGAFILNGLMAAFYATFYELIRKFKNSKDIDFGIIMYGYLSYPLFLHCIDGYLYLLTVRLAFITTTIIFILVYWFVNYFDFYNLFDRKMVLKNE